MEQSSFVNRDRLLTKAKPEGTLNYTYDAHGNVCLREGVGLLCSIVLSTAIPNRRREKMRYLHNILCVATLSFLVTALAAAQESGATPPGATLPTILYGAAYYNEYMPADLQPDRLENDVALMTQAGITVVRMGESTWSLWEPEEGKFEYAWMDRVVDAIGKAGIKVIMGTPTYSIPPWMASESHH